MTANSASPGSLFDESADTPHLLRAFAILPARCSRAFIPASIALRSTGG
jgi:hypothetical protein